MPNPELQKNLPHIIAIIVLLLALLLIATKTGLISCSSMGQGYCDIYYSIIGKPTVLIIRGDTGMGEPDALARMIRDQYQLPVQKLHINQISRGNIQDYSLIIVEHAREIPTEKLKIFNDYLFEDMGRLVWIGDAGTIGSNSDETCKLMQYTVEWKAEDGKHRENYEENICIKENEVLTTSDTSASEILSIKRDALVKKALEHLKSLCEDAFEGKLGISTTKGHPCESASYEEVYFTWTNEESFRRNVNPWARGEYEKLTTGNKQSGIDFAKTVLGVGFVADDYAVTEFDNYYNGIDTIKENLIKAHAGFVACSKNISTQACNAPAKQALVVTSLAAIKKQKDNTKTDLLSIITTLKSIAQQKEATNKSGYQASTTAQHIESITQKIEAITIPDNTATESDITIMQRISDYLEEAREKLVQLKGSEDDPILQKNYDNHIKTIEERTLSVDAAINKLKENLAAYNECADHEITGVVDYIASSTGHKEKLNELTAYSSLLIDETGVVDFIKKVQTNNEWDELASALESLTFDCGSTDFTQGMIAAAKAIRTAKQLTTDPANKSEALAIMQVADIRHPLVEGVTKTKDLKKENLPVPFVLVETNAIDSHEVIQLRVTPAFKGINNWPGITVKDPKFASHVFGRGVVVYYAFPPETDEIFVKNLVEFLLF